MVGRKYCPDCGQDLPVAEFTRDRGRADGLAVYCKLHARRRSTQSKRRRDGAPKHRFVDESVRVPDASKWCPDCGTVKPLVEFPASRSSRNGRHTYCRGCHNARGRASREKVGGSRGYHLRRRYGLTTEEADAMLAAQGGFCAICRAAPAVHVDHDHATNAVRDLLCFHCNGGLGQFRDDPDVLRLAAAYVERHRSAGTGTPPGQPPTPPLGSARRERRGTSPGRRTTDRRAGTS